MVLKRTAAHWRLLSAVIVGVVLAVTIMSSSVVFFESLRDLALRRALAKPMPTELDVLIEASDAPASRATHRELDSKMQGTAVSRLKPFLNGVHLGVKSWTFFVNEPPLKVPSDECSCRATANIPRNPDGSAALIECDCRRVAFYSIPDVEKRTRLVEGRLPRPAGGLPEEGEGLVVEVMLDKPTAARHKLTLGSKYPARPHWEDEHDRVDALVAGIYERADPADPAWRIYDDSFGTRGTSLDFLFFVVPEETVLGGLGSYFPRMGADWAWLVDINPAAIHAVDAERIRATLRSTDAELRAIVDGYLMETELPETLQNFEENLFFSRLPMYIVLILIVLVVLYYVSALAALLVDAQKSEVALLRSRGATSFQVLAVFAIEANLLALTGVILGPLLALGGVSLIGVIPAFDEINNGSFLPVQFTSGVMKLALIGGGLSLIALLLPALRASRIGLLPEKRSRARPARLAFIQRYYLDLGFLGLAVFLFWQLSKQGSFVGVKLFGERTVDQLILAVPAVFMVAVGVALLRVFPLTMDLFGRLLSSGWRGGIAPPSLVLGLWQMARNPAHHARLSLLLILTAGLGVFAASFAATLERSSKERALYDSGADLRTTSISTAAGGQSLSPGSLMESVEGVLGATSIYRDRGSLTAAGEYESFTVIGVDPDKISEVAFFRDDFADRPLREMLDLVKSPEPGGIALPESARWLSILVKPLVRRPETLIVARLSDSNGRFYTLQLGDLTPISVDNLRFGCLARDEDAPPEWCRVGASIWPNPQTGLPALAASPPLRLHSIGVSVFRASTPLRPGAMDIDDISVLVGSGTEMVTVEGFDKPESLDRWRRVFSGTNSLGDAIAPVDGQPGVVRFRWTEGFQRELRGLTFGSKDPTVPVLANPAFISKYGVRKGEPVPVNVESVRMEFIVTGVIRYFPTVDPNEAPFAVADRRALHARHNAGRLFGERQPSEYWISTQDGLDYAPLAASVGPPERDPTHQRLERVLASTRVRYGQFIDRAEVLGDAQIDPLVAAGWRALLGISFFTVLVVSAVGFLVHARVSFNARRSEFALLRTIGLSMRQLLTLVVLEQLLVIGVAIALGIFMGARLGNTIMPYLANSGEGVRLTPPMTVEIGWAGFATTFGLLAGVFGLVMGAILVSVYTMSIHRVMRMGEG
jgi:ABC-type lipoprotein release transport system permease subunit